MKVVFSLDMNHKHILPLIKTRIPKPQNHRSPIYEGNVNLDFEDKPFDTSGAMPFVHYTTVGAKKKDARAGAFCPQGETGKERKSAGRAGKGENLWGGAKKRINRLIPRQRVFNVPLASGELGMVSK